MKGRVSLVGGDWGDPPTNRKIGLSPHVPPIVLTQKCQFCHFHAVFGHFAQIAPPPPVDPIWETLKGDHEMWSINQLRNILKTVNCNKLLNY